MDSARYDESILSAADSSACAIVSSRSAVRMSRLEPLLPVSLSSTPPPVEMSVFSPLGSPPPSGLNAYGLDTTAAQWQRDARTRHRHPESDTWRMALQRRWTDMQRWNWNLIMASFIAVFFFLLWMTSPAGRFIRQHAACDTTPEMLTRHEIRHGHRPVVEKVCPVCPPAAAVPAKIEAVTNSSWSSGHTAPVILHASQLEVISSSHKESQIRKVVHLNQKNGPPNLLQFAESTFAPGDSAERHMHESATETFYVRSGTLTIYFDGVPEQSTNAMAAASTSHHSTVRHVLVEHDSVTIPPKQYHCMANEGTEPLELVYFTLLTP
jgi:mannose-6-phosphate isomerase-like protein (cupin superfamily)